MKFPKKLKFKKYFKTKLSNKSLFTLTKSRVLKGKIGLQVLEQGKLKNSEIESCRISIRRMSKRRKRIWKYWLKLFPYCPIYKKSVGVRMGKGKGTHKNWFCPVSFGQIIFEIHYKSKKILALRFFKAFSKTWRKLSVNCDLAFIKY